MLDKIKTYGIIILLVIVSALQYILFRKSNKLKLTKVKLKKVKLDIKINEAENKIKQKEEEIGKAKKEFNSIYNDYLDNQ